MGEPRLILLDEPTAGMDPNAKRALWNVIMCQKRQGSVPLVRHYKAWKPVNLTRQFLKSVLLFMLSHRLT